MVVFGGSWGSTLALYTQFNYPEFVPFHGITRRNSLCFVKKTPNGFLLHQEGRCARFNPEAYPEIFQAICRAAFFIDAVCKEFYQFYSK